MESAATRSRNLQNLIEDIFKAGGDEVRPRRRRNPLFELLIAEFTGLEAFVLRDRS
jgi:hypothetical protein